MNFIPSSKSHALLLMLLLMTAYVFGQEKNPVKKDSVPYITLYDLFKKKENRIREEQNSKSNLIILPTLGLQPANGFTFGFISQYSFKHNENDKISLLSGGASYSTKKQILTYVKNNMYLDNDTYFLSGDYRYFIFSQSNFGLSTNIIPYGADFDNFSFEAIEQPMKYNYFKFHQTASYRVLPSFYIGTGIHIDDYSSINDENLDLDNQEYTYHYNYSQQYGYNHKHYTVAGASLNLIYDSRDNLINTNKGLFVNLSYRFNPEYKNSQQQSTTLSLDARYFIPLSTKNKQHVLGFWTYGQFLTSGNLPYLNLPALGWDANSRSGKGYTQGLFRGAELITFETEYRFPIAKNQLISGTFFVNATSASDVKGKVNLFHTFQPAVGVGLRVLLDKKTLTNFLMNFGLGRDSKTFYFNDGESF
ncbi:BamA/TamA family outer membrane protein [Flavobacterium sp.]|uniref:BamA/TamA family outer membrane protein n=1 Tax=Flavobacterium sp. TaxID=239 RepID=UPI002606568D|nr:BamA/TamA family outer membrane protein [Flavobacterium sp.]MDD3004553.1 BamA/TamA family outer membrane protein [Flavobacterium sp.]